MAASSFPSQNLDSQKRHTVSPHTDHGVTSNPMASAAKFSDRLHQVHSAYSPIDESCRFNEEHPERSRFTTLRLGEGSTLEEVPNDIGKRKRKDNIPTELMQNTFKRLRSNGSDHKSVTRRQITRKRTSRSAECAPTINITASASLSSALGATADTLSVGLGSDSNTEVDKLSFNSILSSILPQESYHTSIIHNTFATTQVESTRPRAATTDYTIQLTESPISAAYPKEIGHNRYSVHVPPYTQPTISLASDFLPGDNYAVESPSSARNHHHYLDYDSKSAYNNIVGNAPKVSPINSYDLPSDAAITETVQSVHCNHEEFEFVHFQRKCGCIFFLNTSTGQIISKTNLERMLELGEQRREIALRQQFHPPESDSEASGLWLQPSSHTNHSASDVSISAHMAAHMTITPRPVRVPPLTIPIGSGPSNQFGGSSSPSSILTSVDGSNYTSTPSEPNGNCVFEWPSPQCPVPTVNMPFAFQQSFYTNDQPYLT